MLMLTSFTPRTATQYEAACPTKCSTEQIAGLIYVNIATNFRDSAETFNAHFQQLGVSTFPMSQHSEPEKKLGEKPQVPDTASSGALGGLGSEAIVFHGTADRLVPFNGGSTPYQIGPHRTDTPVAGAVAAGGAR